MSEAKRNGTLITPFGGPIERKMGCWSCTHWENQERARGHWQEQRIRLLAEAHAVATQSPEGEEHLKVKNIRRMVNLVDHAVALGGLGLCLIGKSQSDLVHYGYLCDGWTGREGASVAIAGEKFDKLPEELREDLEGPLRKKDGN